MDNFDIEEFRVNKVVGYKDTTVIKKTNRFIKGPLPLDWFIAAAKLQCMAMNVGLVLWYLSGLKKSSTVSLPNKPLKDMSIARTTKKRALKALEEAGLIKVSQKKGSSPVITILRAE